MSEENTPEINEVEVTTEEEAQDNLPANKITVEDLEGSKKKITVVIDRERIDAKFNEIFGELRNTAQVPGFRIGRAPRRLLEKRFGEEAATDVRNNLVAEALGKAVEDEEINMLGEPDLKLEDIKLPEEGNLEFSVEIEVAPEFELPAYDKIEVTEPSVEVTEERIAEMTKQVLSQRGTVKPVEEAAQAEDQLVADVKLTGEGIDESREDVDYVVAPGAAMGIPLEQLGEKLTGTSKGDTVELEAKVPDTHENEDWRGKDVKVTLTVKEVKRLEVPELTDELAKEFGMESAEGFLDFVKERLASQLQTERTQSMHQQVCKHLLDNTTMELPEGVTQRQTANVLRRRYVDLLYRGVPREQIDQNLELLEAQAAEQANEELRLGFILAKIAKAEEITVQEGEVNARVAEMAMRNGRRPERLRSEMTAQGTLSEVETQIAEQKTVAKLLEMAKSTPATPATPATEAPATEEKTEE